MRGLGLSARQALHIPTAGDFHIDRIAGPARPQPVVGRVGNLIRVGGMDVDANEAPVLATAEPSDREGLVRENEPDPLDAEQTWPTQEVHTQPLLF